MNRQEQMALQPTGHVAANEERWIELSCRVEACSDCPLRVTCQQTVLGEGARAARIMLVGEAPGAKEDQTGRPFVGAAGALLDAILSAADYSRSEVYITNVVKCRPPANRLPKPAEVRTCLHFLTEQITLVDPVLIVCLGALATRTLLDPSAAITRVRGTSYQKDGRHIIPTFHPAALLRDPHKKRPVWEDMQLVKRLDEVM